MKKILALMMILVAAFALCGCSGDDSVQGTTDNGTAVAVNEDYSFTNIYGDKDTICADPECKEHIAYKGETIFCAQHSYMCPVCYTFIMPSQSTCSDPDCIEAAPTLERFAEPENCAFRVIQDGTDVVDVAPCNKACVEDTNLCATHAAYMETAMATYEAGR